MELSHQDIKNIIKLVLDVILPPFFRQLEHIF